MIAQLQRSVEQIDSLLNRNKQQLQGKTMSKSAVGREISVLVNDRRRTGRSMYSSRRSAPSSDTSSVLSDEVLQRRLELENYKEEAAARMVAGRYSQAVDMFTKVSATTPLHESTTARRRVKQPLYEGQNAIAIRHLKCSCDICWWRFVDRRYC